MNATFTNQGKFFSSFNIIIICFVIGMFIGWIISFPDSPQLTNLSQPPSETATILGVTNVFLSRVELWVETVDGNTYRFITIGKEYSWQMDIPPDQMQDSFCQPRILRHIGETAGEIIDCRTVGTTERSCPGDIVSFAISEEGNLWKLEESQSCRFSLILNLILFGPAGFVIGIIIVTGRNIYRDVKSGNQS